MAESAELLKLRDAFAAEHRLRKMTWSGHNLTRLIRLAGRPDAIDRLAEVVLKGQYFRYAHERADRLAMELRNDAFDHDELWGRAGKPLVLIGHPYGLGRERNDQLLALQAAGLELLVDRSPLAGWYGFGSYHVRAWVPGALPAPTDEERAATMAAMEA